MTKLYASCAAMVVVQIGYGGSNILMKIASEKDLNPFVFVVYRHFIAFLLLAPFAYVIDRNKPASLTISTAIKIFLLAILGSTIHLNLFYVGIGYTSPTVASAFSNVIPSLTFVMAVLFRLEKVNIRTARGAAKVAGTILCIGGSLIFTLWKGPYVTKAIFKEPLIDIYRNHDSGNSSGKDWIKGSAFILISDIAWSIWLILQAFVTRKYPAQLTMTVLICLFATAQSGFLALIFARDPEKWKLQWDARLLTIVYSGIVISGVGYFLQTWCISRNGPVFTSMFSPLMLIFVAIFSAFVFSERLHVGSLVGAFFIVLGLYLVLWGKKADHVVAAEPQEKDKVFVDTEMQNTSVNDSQVKGCVT
ncbi:WAT1-related protein At1g43650-like [Cucurbita maxima]|uniref:WAT1-related protein n=1 Tax=Cucurbita maxima TaxID=3661 RepID=A0A6J1I2R9_CUCMA|nr:WAT1-related protein At1g43650-like [Cucurbita maxima]